MKSLCQSPGISAVNGKTVAVLFNLNQNVDSGKDIPMMNQKQKALTLSLIITTGFAASVIFHYLLAHTTRWGGYPNSTFLFIPGDRFMDFYNIFDSVRSGKNPFNSWLSVYPPLAYALLKFLALFLTPHAG